MNGELLFLDGQTGSAANMDKLRRARAHLRKGENRKAQNLALEVLESAPLDADALSVLAVSSYNLHNVPMATAVFEEALLLDPANTGAHYYYGFLLERLGKSQEAAGHFQRCVELQPDFPEAYIHLGDIAGARRDLPGARDAYEAALARLPECDENCFQRGYLFSRLERHEKAMESFQHAIALHIHEAASHSGVGCVLSSQGRDAEALEHFQRAAALEPGDPNFHYNSGLSFLRLKKYRESVDCFVRALELDTVLWNAVMDNMPRLVSQAPPELVRYLLDKLEKICPLRSEPPFFRAMLMVREGAEPETVLPCVEESLKRDPGMIQALHLKGNLLRDAGRYADALGCFDAMLSRSKDASLAHYGRATVLALLGRDDDALKALEEVSHRDRNLLNQARDDAAFRNLLTNPVFCGLVQPRKISIKAVTVSCK
ncbi:MAG: tetratricopeptide repeat protein [Deltaproteobacteria bacterium]|nr:tetratricopeptide repeat protein [Deltaproteobacteria bacterium]